MVPARARNGRSVRPSRSDLHGAGHQIDVLTGFPNYPTRGGSWTATASGPTNGRDTASGIPVHRAPLWPNHDSRAAARMVNYLSFAAGASTVSRTRLSRPDVWLVYSSPATSVLPAVRLLRRHRAPYFLLVQDLWPDSVTDSGFVGGRAGEIARAVAELVLPVDLSARCWGGRDLAGHAGSARDPWRSCRPDPLHPQLDRRLSSAARAGPDALDRKALGLPEGPTWMYAGNLGELQGLQTLVEAFAQRPRAHLVLLGDGVAREDLVAQAERLGATNVTFLPRVPTEEVGAYLAASDAQVVSLQDSPLLRVTMPSKVQAAMAAGRPILSHAAGDAAEVVTGAGAGWSAAPGDVASVLAAIDAGLAATSEELRTRGRAARDSFETHYSPGVGPQRLAGALEEAVAASSAVLLAA